MRFKNIKFLFIIFVILIVIFAIFKVNSKNNKKQANEISVESKEIVYQESIRFGISNVNSVNPLLTRNKQLIDIYQLVYEPLLTLDENYRLNNCLATECAKTSATTYIVKVDDSIKWSDGTKLSAKDVKYTVELLKSKDNIFSENVKNIESVEAIDDKTVKFNLSEETYFFEYNLIFPIMSEKYYNNDDFLSFNCKDVLLSEKSVRQAIGFAIDKDNIVSTIYNNKYYPSEYVLDYGSFAYSSDHASSGYNPEKAKEILANDGWAYTNNRWRKNGRILSVTISVNSSNEQRCEVADNIKEQLENIGIQVNVWKVSDSQYMSCLNNKNYQILLTGVYNSYSPELTYFYGKDNISNYYNEEVELLIEDVKNITDEKLLLEKYKTLISITKDECPYVSLCRNKNFLLINQNVVGNFEPTNYGVFRNFWTWNRE